ncbi:hypothetical protein BH23ACT11_BH23ACT11_26820 [soil metagenome]
MSRSTRYLLLAGGALWGVVLAIVPAEVAFAGPLNFSPFLITAMFCAALSGAGGTLAAGRWARRTDYHWNKQSWLRWLLSSFATGVVQTLAVAVFAALSIWLAMTITMTGFSTANPTAIYLLVTQPTIFLQSAIVARTVLVYALIVGAALAPLSGTAINWAAGRAVASQ